MKIHKQVAHASKFERKCRKCSTKIQIGQVYYWIKHRNMPTENFCKDHYPKPRDLTLSDKLRTLYDAQESLEQVVRNFEGVDVSEAAEWQGESSPVEPDVEDDNPDKESIYSDWEGEMNEWEDNRAKYQEACSKLDSALSDLASELESIEESVREVADGYHEGADAQEEYFPNSSKVEENREKGDNAEEWADAINYAASEIEDLRGEIDADSPEKGRNLTEIFEEAMSVAQTAADASSI